jgi:PEP-CTERM motif
MQTKLIVTTAALLGLAAPAHAQLFNNGSALTIAFENSPTSETDTVEFLPGTTQLVDGGNLDLTISVVAAGGGAEWVVLNFQTVSADLPLSTGGQDWALNPSLTAAVPLNFTGDYFQWQGSDGANIPQTGRIFGQTLMASPVAGLTGSGEGTLGFVDPIGGPGLLPPLGAFSDPFSIVLNGLPADQVNGYTEALEFSPVTPSVPEPSTWAMMLAGFAGLSFLGYRQTVKARLAA